MSNWGKIKKVQIKLISVLNKSCNNSEFRAFCCLYTKILHWSTTKNLPIEDLSLTFWFKTIGDVICNIFPFPGFVTYLVATEEIYFVENVTFVSAAFDTNFVVICPNNVVSTDVEPSDCIDTDGAFVVFASKVDSVDSSLAVVCELLFSGFFDP